MVGGATVVISRRPPLLQFYNGRKCQFQCRSRSFFSLKQYNHLSASYGDEQIKFFERRARVTADSEGIYKQRLTAPKQSEKELPEASCP